MENQGDQRKTPRHSCLRGDRLCLLCVLASVLSLLVLPALACAQDPGALETAQAMERLVTSAIERAEKSVVAIARIRREIDGDPDELAADPGFVPSEFGTGIVIDA